MPQTRYPVGGASYDAVANSVTANLNASADSGTCEFLDWFYHLQIFNGMWVRKWVYNHEPLPATGAVVSGAPSVSYTYCDLNYTVQVVEEKERASYCSGAANPMQLVSYSDSTTGGLGISGTFTTSAVGYSRRKWLEATDTESNCQHTTNGVIGKVPGVYDPSLDTSATIGSHIANMLMQCETVCPTFNQSLVDY